MGLHFTEVSVMRVVECSPLHHYGWVKMELKIALLLTLREYICEQMSPGGGGWGVGCSQQALYGEASPRGPTFLTGMVSPMYTFY